MKTIEGKLNSNTEFPMKGFHVDGLIARSRREIMGDPCQILPEALYDRWCDFALSSIRGQDKWRTVWFAGVPIKVILTGADGLWWGCGIDTATVIRMLRSDLELLKENYGN